MMRTTRTLFAAAALAAVLPASALTLTFEGLLGPAIGEGPIPAGAYPGVEFSPSAVLVVDEDMVPAGGGSFDNAPTPPTVLSFDVGTPAPVMNVAAGFNSGFSFFYASASFPGQVSLWSEVGGAANDPTDLIATFDLSPTGGNCPSGALNCNWVQFSPDLGGKTVRSVVFGGTGQQILFDNVAFDTTTPPIPEPSTYALMALGLAAVAGLARRRRNIS